MLSSQTTRSAHFPFSMEPVSPSMPMSRQVVSDRKLSAENRADGQKENGENYDRNQYFPSPHGFSQKSASMPRTNWFSGLPAETMKSYLP